MKEGKEADVVVSGASDRGSKVGLGWKEVAGQRRWFLSMQCQHACMPARPP